jgi:hypothetical protein
MSHSEESVANKQTYNVLDLVNLIFGSLHCRKDDQQLLALVCCIKGMG